MPLPAVSLSQSDYPPCAWTSNPGSCPRSTVRQQGKTKADFLQELRGLHAAYQRAWPVCGDFNLIHLAQDKNNGRLNLREMRRFRAVLQELELAELHLNGRLFTWSNERRHPTLERIDRAFAVVDWLDAFPAHHLKCVVLGLLRSCAALPHLERAVRSKTSLQVRGDLDPV